MSANRYKAHVLILTEDHRTREIASGFVLEPALNVRQLQVLPHLHGWESVVEAFETVYRPEMRKFAEMRVVLVIDFDRRAAERLRHIQAKIPPELRDRVFVLGVWSQPEDLTSDLKLSCETIGRLLAQDCANGTAHTWGHALLKHNAAEVERLTTLVKPFLFSQ